MTYFQIPLLIELVIFIYLNYFRQHKFLVKNLFWSVWSVSHAIREIYIQRIFISFCFFFNSSIYACIICVWLQTRIAPDIPYGRISGMAGYPDIFNIRPYTRYLNYFFLFSTAICGYPIICQISDNMPDIRSAPYIRHE